MTHRRAPHQTYLQLAPALDTQSRFVAGVRREMRRKLWTQDNLAEKSGVPIRTVENILRESNQPTLAAADAICRALGVPLSHVLGEASASPLECVHRTRWLEGTKVCQACTDKFTDYQRRLKFGRSGSQGWQKSSTGNGQAGKTP